MNTLYFDIETAPDMRILRARWPYPGPPPHPGEFDQSTVKTGNTKDPKKIAVKVAEEEAKHARACAEYDASLEDCEARHWQNIISSKKVQLNPATSKVCAVGIAHAYGDQLNYVASETSTEDYLLSTLASKLDRADTIVGWNIIGFDLPYLEFRCRVRNIPFPRRLRNGRYYARHIIDLMLEASAHQYGNRMSLKVAALAFGHEASPDADGGANFYLMPRDQQSAYLRWDIAALRTIGRRYMDVIEAAHPHQTEE